MYRPLHREELKELNSTKLVEADKIVVNDGSPSFKKIVNLGDRVSYINNNNSMCQGEVNSITQEGIGVKAPQGTYFYEWCCIKFITKKVLVEV